MKDIFIIVKKELRGVCKDKIILLQMIFLPFIIVFGYALLMSVITSDATSENTENVSAYSVNAPEYMSDILEKLNIEPVSENETEDIKDKISKKECDLIMVFPEDFIIDDTGRQNLSDIKIWYNSSETKSVNLFTSLNETLNKFQPVAFTVNADEDETYDLGDPNYMVRNMLGAVMPIMILMSVYTICMNIAAESIAGDKERGFLNTVLITPVKRRNIAAGKAISIFVVAIIGGISSFLGMAAALPKITEAMQFENTVTYSFKEYILLFLVTITAVFALCGILLIISTLASSVKQATSISPIFVIAIAVIGMLRTVQSFGAAIDNLGIVNSIIPVWNAMDSLQKIIAVDFSSADVITTCCVNLVFAIASVFIIGKAFENDKIVNG